MLLFVAGDVLSSAFGGLLFVGRSRYNDIVRIYFKFVSASFAYPRSILGSCRWDCESSALYYCPLYWCIVIDIIVYKNPLRSNILGTVGVFDGWSSYGTLTLERGRTDCQCEESAVDNRRPLIFDEGESFTLRVRWKLNVISICLHMYRWAKMQP